MEVSVTHHSNRQTDWGRPAQVYRFRNSVVIPGARVLLRDSCEVNIGARALDVLMILLAHRGTVVSGRAIIEHAWSGIHVEPENLRFQIATLRKALGPDRDLLKTVAGRGYLFATDYEHKIEEDRA